MLQKTLTTGFLGYISKINTQRIYIYYWTIKASSGEYRCVYDDVLIVRNIKTDSWSVYLWNVIKHSHCKCYLQGFTPHHHLPSLSFKIWPKDLN